MSQKIEQRDSIRDDVSLFDNMSEGLAELLQSCSIIEDKTKKDNENGEQQRTDTINIPSERDFAFLVDILF